MIKTIFMQLCFVSWIFPQIIPEPYVFGSGGGTTESGSYQLSSTVGQPLVTPVSSGMIFFNSGFWPAVILDLTVLTVNTIDDVDDGTCDSTHCSLREAIIAANSDPVQNTIVFNITSSDTHAIVLNSPLPIITTPVIIDGTTEPDFNGSPIIELDGSNAGIGTNGLEITAGNCIIRGLVINRFDDAGIYIHGSGNNIIVGNFIGTDITGTVAFGDGKQGVRIFSSPNNTIGGRGNRQGNVISGNEDGILITGNMSTGNVLIGNNIGTDVNGTVPVGNAGNGIRLDQEMGIPTNNTIGGSDPGAANTIAYNGGAGVVIVNGTEIGILSNSIYANGSLGIDLADSLAGQGNVTHNDPGDPDVGPNNLQNFPVLTSVISNGNNTIIQGTLSSSANTAYTLEFFTNDACDTSGHGEGEIFLGNTSVTIDSTGNTSFAVTLPVVYQGERFFAATATDPDNNTSEFSQCVEIITSCTIWHVSTSGSDEIGGGSEENPFASIQHGIDMASDCDTVLVHPGTYVENINFNGKNIVVGSLMLTTGDTSYIPETLIDGNQNGSVVTFESGEDSTTILSGFTITNGLAIAVGGGIRCDNSSPVISQCIITNNYAGQYGGGIYSWGSSVIQIENCRFISNEAYDSGGAIFYGISDTTNSTYRVNITNTVFTNNVTSWSGGGVTIGNYSSDLSTVEVIINECEFINNSSDHYSGLRIIGGATNFLVNNSKFIGNEAVRFAAGAGFSGTSTGTISNCLFTSNIAATDGGNWNSGGVSVWSGANVDFMNCTFTGNSAAYGSGLTVGGGGIATTTNCVFWGNGNDQIALITWESWGGTLAVNYCDIQDGLDFINVIDSLSILNWGIGNIDADPLFEDPGSGDFHLQDASPCIGAGIDSIEIAGVLHVAPGTDIEGNPRPYPAGSDPDIGAYESPYAGSVQFTIDYLTGWNMVGLPLVVNNAYYRDLFPEAELGTLYSFSGTYQSRDSLQSGEGYLLRLSTGGFTSFTGLTFDEVTINLQEGWNIISGISTPVGVNELYSSGLILLNTIYGYAGTYYNPETIDPGRGYWVKSSTGGELTIPNVGGMAKSISFVNHLADANTIEFTNADGYSTTLYFGKELPEDESINISLPPVFPGMMFDVRFTGDLKYVKDSGEIEVLNSSEVVTVTYNIVNEVEQGMEWVLTAVTGEEYVLTGSSKFSIYDNIEKFTLTGRNAAVLPVAYALHQNYPNPFNPTTTLRYDLPERSEVILTIYDILGRQVRILAHSVQEPGFKIATWDGRNDQRQFVGAGVYLYQIRAGDFVKTRKMILLR